MWWELVLTVSVYQRRAWNGGLRLETRPSSEERFATVVSDKNDQGVLNAALHRVAKRAEGFLNQVRPNLISDVVVSVYSLEVTDELS